MDILYFEKAENWLQPWGDLCHTQHWLEKIYKNIQVLSINNCECSVVAGSSVSTLITSGTFMDKGEQKNQKKERRALECWLIDVTGCCRHLLTEAMATWTNQSKFLQGWSGAFRTLSIAEELLTDDGRWCKECHVSLGKRLLIRCSCPSRWPHNYMHMCSANWAQLLILKKNMKVR